MRQFLSSNAQDFIEELQAYANEAAAVQFLSSNAQDFIEEPRAWMVSPVAMRIPEQ